MFPNRVRMEILHLQSQRFSHSFTFVGVPTKKGGKHLVTVHGASRGRKAYTQWGGAWFPKGIIRTLPSLPQCHTAFSTIPSTLAWVDQGPVSQPVS